MLDNLLITKHKIRNKYPNSQTFLTKRFGSLDYLVKFCPYSLTKTNTNNYEKVIINTRLCDDKLVRISAGKDSCGRS